MKWIGYAGAAVLFHLALLLGLGLGHPAVPWAMEDRPVEISVVAAPAAEEAAASEVRPPTREAEPSDAPMSEPPRPAPEASPMPAGPDPAAESVAGTTPEPTPLAPEPSRDPAPTAQAPSKVKAAQPSAEVHAKTRNDPPRQTKGENPGQGERRNDREGAPAARNMGRPASPRYRSNPQPEYPAEARAAGQQGVVLIAVEVSAAGDAMRVSLERGSGFAALDQAALRAVRGWKFEPGRAAGLAVPSRVVVPVRFRLE